MAEELKGLSRRDLLKAGAVVAGVLAAGELLGNSGLKLVSKAFAAGEQQVPAWPWPYKKLDPAAVKKMGYDFYYQGGCCYGAARAMLTELQSKVGYPYQLIPADMFRYGEGGMVGWGTICGALNGASAIINLVTPKEVYPQIVGELMGWYTLTQFPSKDHDAYAKFKDQPQNACGSTLCHVSVTEWCKLANKKVSDAERKDRCAKLTGDVAAKAVEYLNLWADGKFTPVYKPTSDFASCMGCHVGPTSTLNNVQGKQNCVQCHEPHIK